MAGRIANIGAAGERRRFFSGVVWAALTIAAVALMLALRAPRWSALLLSLPIGLAAAGFLQAREKT